MLAFVALMVAAPVEIQSADALSPFFSALGALERGEATDNVDIVTFGNSLICADNIVNIVRRRLQTRFGDGGRGLLTTERVGAHGYQGRAGVSPGGWASFNLAMGPPGRGIFGLGGVFHESKKDTRTEWPVRGERRAELFWFDHEDAPAMELRADGAPIAVVTPEKTSVGKSTVVRLPAKTQLLSLHVAGPHAIVFGVSLERDGPGVVLDTVGLPAAEAGKYLTADPTLVAQHLSSRRPALAVFMLGGNEMRRLSWSRLSVNANKAKMKNDLAQFIERTKPTACMVIGPIDAVYGPDATEPSMTMQTRAHVRDLLALEQSVALAQGCAFFDLFSAMGGAGSLATYQARGWLADDLVHPKGEGLNALGALVARALLRAYDLKQPAAQFARNP